MPLVPKGAPYQDQKAKIKLTPRSKRKLCPRLDDDGSSPKSVLIPKKPKGLVPKKPKGLTPKASVIEQLNRNQNQKKKQLGKGKEKDHAKSFAKWYKILEDGAICLAEEMMGRTKFRIVFNPNMEHFLVQYIDLDNKASSMKTTFPVALMRLMRAALRRAEQSNLIKFGRAMQQAPPEEEETAK
jgi:hypothetical protein